MIHAVEKRRFRRSGDLRETRSYYLRYRYGDMPADKWKSLKASDKQVAEQRAIEFRREWENETAGIIQPRPLREAAARPLAEHLKDYVADLHKRARAGRGGRGAKLTESRINRLLSECNWRIAANINANAFVTWRTQQTCGARTANHYLQAAVSFLNWLERVGRIATNPLRLVSKVDERGQRKRIRRAFTDEELRKLVEGSGPRGLIYFTAARTGLRQEELRQLTWADVRLEAKPPVVVVRDTAAKNKREEAVPLLPEIVQALRQYRPAHWSPTDPVFPNGIPRAFRLKKDAERNGVVYRDSQGRYADFHALRYTWATFLQRHGVSQRIAMQLMRHSDIKLTAKVYTDESQLPIHAAIASLPPLFGYAHGYAQISGASGQNGSQAVASKGEPKQQKSPVNGAVCRTLTMVVGGRELERAKGFELSALSQNQAETPQLSGGCTQICAQNSDLQRIVAAWPTLSQPLKSAILAIVNSTAEPKP